ncbi:hypothetical protein Lesp02_37500 [Lentzea sp. NBRC 105346]|uniref:P-loop NTPase fold protein n=1 Tax=Lentzea sp. NBRC 105346 TaxID=3032205 RepID=UPI0024A4A1BE|nr:P-loop NTPase fold protein [Lentzea sp. NBRC 105346]GLZ31562.1 hypothetical protein Lesp02_37500 [Lentzea sp. NBRC 105346]
MSAIETAEAALKRFDGAAALTALEDDTTNRATAGRVKALWLLRRWDEGRAELGKLRDPFTLHAYLARGLVALGQPDDPLCLSVYHGSALRDDVAARKSFDAAIVVDSKSAEAHAGYATALRMSGDLKAAENALAKAPPSAPVLVERAICAMERTEDASALAYLDRALEADPGDLRAKLLRIRVLARRYDVRQEALELAYAEPAAVVLTEYGCVLEQHGGDARAQFQRALKTGPRLPRAAIALDTIALSNDRSPALARYRAGESRSLHVWQGVLDFDPRDLPARLKIAELLYEQDKLKEARDIVAPMRDELPGNEDVRKVWLRITKQSTPWQMPEPYQIRHRRDMPQDPEEDVSGAVLAMLTEEVVENYGLSPEISRELRDKVTGNPRAVLACAEPERQEYQRSRRKLLWSTRTHRPITGLTLGGLGVGGTLALLWVLLQSTGLSPTASLVWSIVILTVLAGAALLDVEQTIFAPLAGGLAVLAGPVGVIWLSIHQLGLTGGLLGLFAVLVAVGAYGLSRAIRNQNEETAQHNFDVWLESLFGKGLLPAATEVGNRVANAFSTWLPAHSQRVVGEIVDVDTFAVRELRRLSRLGRGSFALAGPRGAGKSTLLQRWCEGEYIDGDRTDCEDLAIQVAAPVGYSSEEFLIHLFDRTCDAVEKYAREHEDRRVRFRAKSTGDDVLAPGELARLAQSERDRLRFLLSRTMEREASIDTPVAKGKGKYQTKRDDIPLNHPQRVDRFRDFLRKAADCVGRATRGKVLVAIDELDRISDGERAQQFLNELKAVFNVPNCFFLVAVSEDALADFDLKAMGMRTVFDSAFDTIVRVDYLRFQEAKTLLKSSMVDVPEQFVALAYVLSGGLARELIRTVDVMGALPPDETRGRGLQRVAAHLAQRLLDGITRAAMDRLSREDDRKAGAALIPVLDEHPDDLTGDLLREYGGKVEAAEVGESAKDVQLDVVVLTQYLATLLDVFDGTLDEPRMRLGLTRGPGDFETLARVRRYLGANPYGAQELLRAFAKVWKGN